MSARSLLRLAKQLNAFAFRRSRQGVNAVPRAPLSLVLLAAAVLFPGGCQKSESKPASPPPLEWKANPGGEPSSPAPHAEERGHGAEKEEEHAHAGEEASDLDRPVEELFAATCEHGLKSFECDECRYEMGVVKAPESLFQGGLLKRDTVGRQDVATAVAVTGEIGFDDRQVMHLSPRVEGVIRQAFVGLGQRVRKDQPLIELESVALGEAQAQYLETQAAVGLVRRTHDWQVNLRKEQLAAERDVLEARIQLEGAEIRARSAGDKLLRLGMTAGEVQALGAVDGKDARGILVMRAPAAGTVLRLHAVPGEAAKQEESLLVIGDLSTLWLWADLYENDLAVVSRHIAKGGLRAGATVKAFPAEEFPGAVDLVGPTMDEATRTVKVRISIKNSDGKLRPGMFATVRLYLPTEEQVVAVPRRAVLEDAGRSFVFIRHHGDFYVRRPITPGRSWDAWVEVKAGVKEGTTLVTDGCFLLKSDVLRSKMGAGCAD